MPIAASRDQLCKERQKEHMKKGEEDAIKQPHPLLPFFLHLTSLQLEYRS